MEIERLINYKGTEVFIRKERDKFQVGIGNSSGLVMWLDNGVYDNIDLAVTSGMEYARIVIDNIIVGSRKGG